MKYAGIEPMDGYYNITLEAETGELKPPMRFRISDEDMRRIRAAEADESRAKLQKQDAEETFHEVMGELAGKLTVDELLKFSREIWGANFHQELPDIVVRLMVGVGDIARIARDTGGTDEYRHAELKKELGNLILSSIRWASDLGFEPGECVRLAAIAQEKFAKSGRAR